MLCLARSEYVYEPLVGLVLALSYFLDGLLKEHMLYRLSFFVVAAWFLLSARLIIMYDDVTHLFD